jgi:1-acyl-sn-glycerol-3-phosphate acyltransferase
VAPQKIVDFQVPSPHNFSNNVEFVTSATDAERSSLTTRVLRVMGRGILAFRCVCGCLTDFMFHAICGRLKPRSRAAILQKWSTRLLSSIGVQVHLDGEIPERGLIISNHLSYLDILVFSAVSACVFVSKREVKSWPGIGWISSLAGTIYIDRTRPTNTQSAQNEMQSPLLSGVRLVLFPEGTSSDGSSVMHFHSSLFQPAVELKMPITAAAIEYSVRHGNAALEACYWGTMRMAPHLLSLLTKESVQASLRFSREQLTFKNRKEAARIMQSRVEHLRSIAVRA